MASYNDILSIITSNLASGTNITAEEHRAVEEALLNFTESQWLTGDIKEIDCTDAYIAANFDNTNGIGIIGGEREGWAICNGQNGTRNRTGRVSIGYGTVAPAGTGASSQPLIGATINAPVLGGSKDAIVVEHSHSVFANESQNTGLNELLGSNPPGENQKAAKVSGDYAGGDFRYSMEASSLSATIGKSSITGDSAANKNMQPYIVTLFIQKL
jgi:hypothetical protein